MNRETRQAASAVSEITARSAELVEEYTAKLDAYVDVLIPSLLDNAEYAARTSALMIALNRELARCAVAFGAAHEILPEAIVEVVVAGFVKNLAICSNAIDGQSQLVQ
jgi:16S rRNA C1402 N4-methylase RsmH